MTSSVTMNAFALLGDTEVDDPELISATIRKPEPAAPVKPAPEKPKKAPAPGMCACGKFCPPSLYGLLSSAGTGPIPAAVISLHL